MFGIGRREEIKSSMFLAQRHKKCELKGCAVEQKVSDWQMNVWTMQTCDIVRDW